LVAREILSGRCLEFWREDLLELASAPFDTGSDSLFVAYLASAELGVFLALGWPLPFNVLDLYVEHRCLTNGRVLPAGNSLIGALEARNLPGLDSAEKDNMRGRILQGPPYTAAEQANIIRYCAGDTAGLERLLQHMTRYIDWPRALYRGRYLGAVAHMEWNGAPVDVPLWQTLTANWEPLKRCLIDVVDKDFQVYADGKFGEQRFLSYCRRRGIDWPCFEDGSPKLEAELFRDQAMLHPQLAPLHQLRQTLAKFRLTGLRVGDDGRNRCLLSPFKAISGRNLPSSSEFLFGPATWIRSLLKPPPGYALAYIDWAAQEIAIAASLSGDAAMIESYVSGDPHWGFALLAGLTPPGAVAADHPLLRERCKTTNLGVNYGMTKWGLSRRLGIFPVEAREFLRLHREVYWKFWKWVEDVEAPAFFNNRIRTKYGWQLHVTRLTKPRTLWNFPAQAHGAEMMRMAAIKATESGLEICCPVHDAFVLLAPTERIEEDVAAMQAIMRRAGMTVTDGLEVRTDVKIVRYPERYTDKRGADMWNRVMSLLSEIPDAVRQGLQITRKAGKIHHLTSIVNGIIL
jgi:hypothetical protein